MAEATGSAGAAAAQTTGERRWMIYGANGYTGELTARQAAREGMKPILAGRNREAIEALGRELGFETRVFDLSDPTRAAEQLKDVKVVLHCAGPFSATAEPMLEACTRSKTHYLDITGEIEVFEYAQANDAKWKQAGIVAMPGVGFDVVPSDCLAAMLARELPDARELRMAFKSTNMALSPGTTKTMIEGLPKGGKVRRDGKIVRVPNAYQVEEIPFADGPHLAVTIPWGDVSTAFHSTGIPNIMIYIGTSEKQVKQMKMMGMMGPLLGLGPVQNFMKGQVEKKVKGPTEEENRRDRMQLWGEVTSPNGTKVVMTMQTPAGYQLTVDAGIAASRKLMEGDLAPGAYTPSKAFGPDFVKELPGVEVQRVV